MILAKDLAQATKNCVMLGGHTGSEEYRYVSLLLEPTALRIVSISTNYGLVSRVPATALKPWDSPISVKLEILHKLATELPPESVLNIRKTSASVMLTWDNGSYRLPALPSGIDGWLEHVSDDFKPVAIENFCCLIDGVAFATQEDCVEQPNRTVVYIEGSTGTFVASDGICLAHLQDPNAELPFIENISLPVVNARRLTRFARSLGYPATTMSFVGHELIFAFEKYATLYLRTINVPYPAWREAIPKQGYNFAKIRAVTLLETLRRFSAFGDVRISIETRQDVMFLSVFNMVEVFEEVSVERGSNLGEGFQGYYLNKTLIASLEQFKADVVVTIEFRTPELPLVIRSHPMYKHLIKGVKPW
jgi:DNA polymerase III sliding clamp (beta) subunit (PCNA family)